MSEFSNLSMEDQEKEIAKYAQAYYSGTPLITDTEFDELQAEYVANGGTELVGHGFVVEESRKIKHKRKMGSLKKIKDDPHSLKQWISNTQDLWREQGHDGELVFSVSPKFDGLAVSVEVENGNLKMIATRGDGTYGENVLKTASLIPDVQELINLGDGMYYGEVMLPQENLAEANARRDPKDGKLKQVRNAAAGLVKKLNDTHKAAETLVFANHDNGDYVKYYSYDEMISQLDDILNEYEPLRSKYPVKPGKHVFIDGIVIKVENTEMRNLMGYSSGSPKWARAYKYADEIYDSVITGVHWNPPGKIGRITPVLEYETIVVGGADLENATLHNYSQFLAANPHYGDIVAIKKSGDIIPFVVNVEHTGDGDEIPVIHQCPTCGADVAVDGEFLICTNSRANCNPASSIALIVTSLGIKGLQEKTIKKIYDKYLTSIKDPYDALVEMRNLPKGSIAEVDKLGDKAEENIFALLDSMWNGAGTLAQWIRGLNVNRVGNTVSEKLVETYEDLDGIIEAINNPDKYKEVEHLKGVNWREITLGLERFVFLRDWIKDNDIQVKKEDVVQVSIDSHWAGKKVAITGSLGIPRAEAEKWLKAQGAIISSGFDVLIDAGDGSSSKSKKAINQGKQVVTGDVFMEEFNNS